MFIFVCMRKLLLSLWVILPLLAISQVNRPIGINLAGVSDYSTELVFVDAFKQSRGWISSNAEGGGPWDTGIDVPLNAQGYPMEIPYDDGVNLPQIVKTLMIWDLQEATPTGQFRLIAEGSGQIRLNFGASGTYTCPVNTLVDVSGAVMLEILESNASDPVHGIQFILPNYINSYEDQIFTDELTTFLDDFQVIRYMDWLRTNASPVTSWSDRTPVDYYSQAMTEGVAWEYVMALANQTQKDLWINIPHKADDDYITQLAQLLNEGVDENLHIYLEYSNEVWNAAFSQHHDCAELASSLYGYTGQEWERAWQCTARRSADVFSIFENVFENDERLVKVIPSQAANSWLSGQLISYFNDPLYNLNGVSADVLAIAPYFGGAVADQIVTDNMVSSITVEEIISMMQTALGQSSQWITETEFVANQNGLDLVCYEGGQHLVATGNNVNLDELTEKLIAVNRHPDFNEVYCAYLDEWYFLSGGLFCQFSSHGWYSKWGSWGVKEYFDDMLNPKYQALQECVFAVNSLDVNEEELANWSIFPNPAQDVVIIDGFVFGELVTVYNALGQPVLTGKSAWVDLSEMPSGLYFIYHHNEMHSLIKE